MNLTEIDTLAKPVVALTDWEFGAISVGDDMTIGVMGGRVFGHPEFDNHQAILSSAIMEVVGDIVETLYVVYVLIGDECKAVDWGLT